MREKVTRFLEVHMETWNTPRQAAEHILGYSPIGSELRLASGKIEYLDRKLKEQAEEFTCVFKKYKEAEAKIARLTGERDVAEMLLERRKVDLRAAEAETARLRAALETAEKKAEIWGDWIADSMEVLNEACMVSDRDDPPTIVTAVKNAIAALAEAEARGRRQGLEEAAKVAETVYEWSPSWNGEKVHEAIATRIRSSGDAADQGVGQ
jgi:chromosome segregation ATPase